MAYTRGRCTNFDYCSVAESRKDVEVRIGEDFVCPECGKPLKAPPMKGRGSPLVPVLAGLVVLAAAGIGAYYAITMIAGPRNAPPPLQAANTPAPASGNRPAPAAPGPAATPEKPAQPVQAAAIPTAAPAAETVLLRLCGSDTIGANLAPKLAMAYLAQIGDTDIATVPGNAAGETRVVGTRGDRREAILIASGSAAAGFAAIAHDDADVAMAARRISGTERDTLSSLGDMSAATAEHVLGLDGLAVIVNPANRLAVVSRDQIRAIFTGAVHDWSQLGGAAGPIHVLARDDGSDTAATFASLALGGVAIEPAAKRFADSGQLSAAVSADPAAVGFVDLPAIHAARALAVAETGATPVAPTNRGAVATEDYPLSYRLYFYTPPRGRNGFAQRFVDYTLSPAGQAVIEQQGFASQTVKAEAAAVPETASGRFRALVGGAKRLAIDFRFQPNSTELDIKARRDMDRLWNFLVSNHTTADHVILIGFADNQGDPASNLAVSRKRADAVATLFAQRGLTPGKVAGFGAELPVADNTNDDGRERNRRVEVFLRQ